MYICRYIHTYTHICIYIMHIYMYPYIFVYVCIYIYTYMYIYTSIHVYVVVKIRQNRAKEHARQRTLASAQTLHLLRPLVLRKCHENFEDLPPLKPALPFVLLNFRLVTHVVLAQSFLHEVNGLYRLVKSFVFKRYLVANLGCVLLG